MVSSWIALGVAVVSAALMAFAFPKANVTLLAPLGAIGLFWAWFGLSPRRAFLVGWAAGVVFFSFSFSWFGETAGSLIAPFGFLLTLAPALLEGLLGFAVVGALAAICNRTLRPGLVAPASAALFVLAEWVRAEGMGELGLPFAVLGYTQVQTWLAPLASFAGAFGVTFALVIPAAYVAYALRYGTRSLGTSGLTAGCVWLVALALSWLLWPARHAPAPSVAVAAVQGNIAQSLKFKPQTFPAMLDKYVSMTRGLAPLHPQIVLWPETVIPASLNDPQNVRLRLGFGELSRELSATIVVGAFFVRGGQIYNALYFFGPTGQVANIYLKRRLVPFAEHLPFAAVLGRIPWAHNVSDIGMGTQKGVTLSNGIALGPIVCWESAFSDLNQGDVRGGAQALAIATDDAWFGTSDGPYMHAQIAQMRALETGRWVVRAAATGISGIIAPDGRYVRRSRLDEATVVFGKIGLPVNTLFDTVGAGNVALALLAFLIGTIAWGRRSTATI